MNTEIKYLMSCIELKNHYINQTKDEKIIARLHSEINELSEEIVQIKTLATRKAV